MILVALLTIGLLLAVPIGIICGVIKGIKTPSPPPGLSKYELQRWYDGGWKKDQILEERHRYLEEEIKKLHSDDYWDNLKVDKERREKLKPAAQKYLGLSFTDIFHKTMTLTTEGIKVSRTKGSGHRFHRTIPYFEILEVYHYKAKWWKAGFVSLITIESGVAHADTVMSFQQAGDVAADEGTVSYYKGSMKNINKLLAGIHALKEAYYYD